MCKRIFLLILMIAENCLGCGGALIYFAGFGGQRLGYTLSCPVNKYGNRETNMKNRLLKILLWGLVIGLAGMAVTTGIAVGTGRLISREADQTMAADIPFESVMLDTTQADVQFVPSGSYEVEAYAKAWRPAPIDMSRIVQVSVEDGVLTIKETGFPNDFFGVFPQPYELKLTIYAPQGVTAGGAS